MRSLALRSKEAAHKTEELIRQSVQETEGGASTSSGVNEKLTEIAQGISQVTEIVAEIARMAADQASGIEQVNASVGEMEKVTQLNAANAQQSSAAAEELSSQSRELSSMVAAFGVGAKASAPSTVARAEGAPPNAARPVRRLNVVGPNGSGAYGRA